MENKSLRIGLGSVEVFLVKDESLKDIHAPFYKWLIDNGFTLCDCYGHFESCTMVYINNTRKQFAYGRPFIQLARILGNHSITIDEFFTIYNIFRRYEDLDGSERYR